MSSTLRRLFNLFTMIDYYQSNIVIKFFLILSPSLSQILAARLILYKMADSSATTSHVSLCRGEYRFLLFENKTEKKRFRMRLRRNISPGNGS